MLVRISPAHPFRLAFDTLVVEGGGSSEVTDVAEAVAEAVAEVAEDVADAVADAVSEGGSSEPSAEWVERIVKLELAVEALGLAIAELEGHVGAASATAIQAEEMAAEATTPAEVEAMIEETHVEDTDHDGDADIVDAPDEPPAGVGKSLVFASGKELKDRFFKRGSDD